MSKKKVKISRIIFIISFVPYIILILISLYYAIFGYDVYTWILPVYKGTIYGFDAFRETLLWNLIILCYIPILPILLIYQLIYFVRYLIKKN